jgi:hypothetical protein
MSSSACFDKKQRFWVWETLEMAETLTENHFQVDLEDSEKFPYDLQTLAYLKGMEKTHRALAQICKYEYRKKHFPLANEGKEFYRICLQDDKILGLAQADGFPLLKPLLLYVITHELIHVVRFSMDPQKFHLEPKDKGQEEADVHRMTYELLRVFKDPKVEVLLERYRPWWGPGQPPEPTG